MTLVDFINLEDDECYFKVDVIDLSTDEDNVQKDGNVEEEEEDDDVPQSENLAEAATSLPISEQDATAATSLSMVDHGSAMSSLVAYKSMQSENHEFLATSDGAKEATLHELIAAGDCVGEAMQSECEAGVFSSMTEQAAATSLLLTEQGAITSSLTEDKSMQSGNQVFVAEVDCRKEATQSEITAKAAGPPSMTERGATCKSRHVGQLCQMVGCPHIVGDGLDLCISHGGGHPHGERGSSTVPCTKSEVSIKHGRHSRIGVEGAAGNAMGSTGIYNLHAQEELKGDTEKDESCDFEAETEKLSLQDKEKETSRFGKFYNRKGKRQVNTSATACKRQLSIVHSNRVPPTLHNGDSGFSVMGNVCNVTATASIGINVLDCEVVVSTQQGCNKTSKGNTTCGKVHDNGSKSCMVEGCTNGAHGGTPLCIIHNSRPHIRCCAVIGCTKVARTSSEGRRGCCVKHGGGKRCKYDRCGKGAKGKTGYCIVHGGGRRCRLQGCMKGAQGRNDYCVEHGGSRRCKLLGCRASTTCGKDICAMHITNLMSGNNSDHEMLPAPATVHQAKKAEPSKGRNSHSVIGERSQKKQNTNDYVNTRSFNVVETIEEKGRDFICKNNMMKAEQTTRRMNSESGLAEGSPPCKFRKVAQTLNNGGSGFSVMGNVCNGTASIGVNLIDGEVVVSTYQGCSKTSQQNTMCGKVHDSGSESCMVEGCTNGAHGGTPLCSIHNSRPHIRCCAVIGCSKVARTSSQGHRGCCVKHGGGKRCKYDGCGKGAKGNTDYCIAHGGGRRCKFQGCRKGEKGRSDYCLEHGGGRRCKFIGCSASTACGKDRCSMHITNLLSGNNSDHEMLPAPAPAPAPAPSCQAKEAEPSKGGNSHSAIGGRSQKKHNTNDYVNTRIFNVVETIEEMGRDSIRQNNMLKVEQTTPRMNSESGLAAGSPPCKFRKVARTLNNGDGGFSVMGNVRNGTVSIGINTSDGEVVVSTYQGCSKTSQRNTMYGKIHDNGSESCMVESCTNGTHGGTPLCIFHNSRPHVRCCAVIGCSKVARTSRGHRGCCVKHGGGKRCKYDGCGKGAKGKTDYCIAHGGGRRCKFQGCRKGAKGRSDYCLEHGGSRRCKFIGCSASTACGKDLCSVHVTSLPSDNNSDHEMLPAPACEARKAEPSKRRNTHSVIGGISQRRQNTNDYVNTVVEAGEEKGRVFVCQNNMLKVQ